ncbi:MAG: hypothetical protein IM666_15060, partial [Phenylobacterium sp.]|nr:hypothetical protein [Phenylobacterium sp.]
GVDSILGLAGNDTLVGLTGDDTLVGDTGNDSLWGGAGADSLTGGANDDIFVYAAAGEVSAGEALDGGTGTNTVSLTASIDMTGATFSNISAVTIGSGLTGTFSGSQLTGQTFTMSGVVGGAVETLVVNVASGSTVNLGTLGTISDLTVQINGATGNENITGSGAADSMIGLAGNDTLAGGNGDDTLWGDAGADSLVGGANDDTFLYSVASESAAGEAVDGGAGTDTVRVTVATVFDPGATFTQVENLIVVGGIAATLSTAQLAAFSSATGTTGSSALVVNVASGATYTLPNLTYTSLSVSVVGQTGNENITGWTGVDSLSGQGGNDTLVGDAGNDTLQGGAGADSLVGGANDDTFLYTATSEVSVGEVVDGGAGTDTVRVTGTTVFDPGVTFNNVESLLVVGGVTATVSTAQLTAFASATGTSGSSALVVNVASGATYTLPNLTYTSLSVRVVGDAGNENITGWSGVDSLFGQGGNDTLVGDLGNDTLQGGAGTDSLVGGANDDTFIYAASSETAAGEVVDGGAGTDTVRVTGTTVFDPGITISNVENLVVAGVTATLSTAQLTAFAFTSVTGSGGASALVVNVASGATYTLPSLGYSGVTPRVVGDAGNENITGSGVADSLSGLAGNDTLVGLGGDDSLSGGAGVDSLSGGAGADRFVFAAGDTGLLASTADDINDFVSGSDRLALGITAGSATNYGEDLNNAGSFAAAQAVADGLADGVIRYVFVVVGSDGFMFVDRNADGTVDEAIKLTGVTDMAFGDIVV